MKRTASIVLLGLMLIPVVTLGQASEGATPATTPTEQTAPNPGLDDVGGVLLIFLVLSVVFEVALTPIFNWRVFLARFEGKGVKTPVTVILALLVFWGYELDIIRDVLVALGYQASLTFWGQFLTALLIAGGSDGVYQIFTKLKIRNPQERERRAREARAALEAARSDS